MNRAILVLTMLLSGLASASAATVTLTPSSGSIFTSQLFSIDLAITGNSGEILGFGLDYTVGSPAISLQSVVINPFFGGDLGLPGTMLSAITFPGVVDPSVSLVTFNFLAAQAGSSQFSIQSDLLNPDQGAFLLDGSVLDLTSDIMVNVQTAAVPEPATFGLGALALGLAVAARRRQLLRKR